MTLYKRPEIKEELFKANPLVDSSFRIVVNKITDTKTFQNDDGILIHKEFEMEKENVTKVYTKPEYRQLISQLSPKAKSLFLWLIYEADSGKDYIWVNKQRYMKENDITSINTYKTAIEELVTSLILATSLVKDVYWLNPRLFFSGNRVNKYPNHVEVYKPKTNKI